jgi:DNA-binding Lrp family transcriptional regulator
VGSNRQSRGWTLVSLINLYGILRLPLYILSMMLDDLDRQLIAVLTVEPRIGVLEASRRLRVARGTVQARLDRLVKRGIIKDFAPSLDPAALGWVVTAFATIEISQGAGRDEVAEHLASIPEVLEVHTITGQGDLLCRLVGRSNEDLQRVIDDVVATSGIQRTSTVIALAPVVAYRVLPLVTQGVPESTIAAH